MATSRRQFIKLTLNGAVLLGAGGILQAFDNGNKLPPKRKISLRFVVASDGHFGQPKTEYANMHTQMIEWINAEEKSRGLDFAFINGDMYHDDISFSPIVKSYWDRLHMPYYVSHGNHDNSNEADWEKAWGKPWHYGFEKGNYAFAVLNTANETGKYICPDLEKTRQLLTQYNQHKMLFVVMHITPVKWTVNGVDCPEVVTLFNQQANLKAIFNGHDHDQDNVKEKDGKHYFFDSHIGGSWGTNYRGYRIVEVLKNGDVLTYQMNPSEKLKVNSTTLV
ncbi:MAG: metallophosphoesterase [Bacteroidota bacterium]